MDLTELLGGLAITTDEIVLGGRYVVLAELGIDECAVPENLLLVQIIDEEWAGVIDVAPSLNVGKTVGIKAY